MAETINMILESMLPHLEELQQVGIFEESEIRTIIKKRRQMEYKLFRRPPKKEDYLKAIEYEHNLDKLRKLRKERMGVVGISQDGEFGIANRIHGLYRRATKHFKGDIKLWLQHIKHCRQLNQFSMSSRLYGRVLAVHPTHVGLWIMAAKFEFEDRQDTAAARVLFQEGLRANSMSEKLWLEYYRMELMVVDKLRKRRNVLALNQEDQELPHDDVMNYGVSRIVYSEAIKAIPNDIEFRLAFLPILLIFEDTSNREQEIFDDLQADFPTSGFMYDAVAKRNWLRVSDINDLPAKKVKKMEGQTEQLYREGIAALVTHNAADQELVLWECFIVWLVDRLKYWSMKLDNAAITTNVTKLLDICTEASSREMLTESLALRLVNILQSYGLQEATCTLAQKMVSFYPLSSELWLTRLHCEVIHSMDFSSITDLFYCAISSVSKQASLDLWQFMINQAILAQSEDKLIESIFKECLDTSAQTVSQTVLIQYFDWAYIKGGIAHVQNIYDKIRKDAPHLLSVQTYTKVITLEKFEEITSENRIIDLFETALNQHGVSCPDLWLDYISTLTHFGGKHITRVSPVYWRAIKTLDGSLTSEFMTRHSCVNV